MNGNHQTSEANRVLEPSAASTDADARERLILTLLEEPTFKKAAAAAGMSLSTAYRLKGTSEFEREFRKARDEAFGVAMSHLLWVSGNAVLLLISVFLRRTIPMKERLRAADLLLTHAAEARMEELNDLMEHVEKLREDNRHRKQR